MKFEKSLKSVCLTLPSLSRFKKQWADRYLKLSEVLFGKSERVV